MKKLLVDSLLSLGTGLIVGILFSLIRLPVPAPSVLPGVVGILGITVGYLLVQHFVFKQ